MAWWKRLFGDSGGGESPAVEFVRLDWAMPIIEQNRYRTVWRDSDGDVVSLDVVESLDLPQPLTDTTVQAYFREMAEDRQGGLVEAQLMDWRSGVVVEGIYKFPRGMGFVFTGILVMRLRDVFVVWTTSAAEHGTTGIREAVVSAQMLQAGSLTVESYTQSWAQDPYDSEYRALGRVDFRTLRYASDAAQIRSTIPEPSVVEGQANDSENLDGR